MIGQENLLKEIDKQIKQNTFPRFAILVGARGSGKKLLANHIGELLNAIVIETGTGIDDVRAMIENTNKMVSTTLHIIPDADSMSIAARNAMLKVVEEPPNNAYFIMTLENENNTLSTIRSRGTLFHMDNYSQDELTEFCKNQFNGVVINLALSTCETPGELELMYSINIKEFENYVHLVIDNIAEVSGANAFKIADKVALKDGAEGYDLKLFWKAFISTVVDMRDKSKLSAILITDKALQQLRIKGINRAFLMDKWILDIRQAWMEV